VSLGRKKLAVERQALEDKSFAVEHERPLALPRFGIGPDLELGVDTRFARIERNVELDRLDEVVGRRIVHEQFRLSAHIVHETKTPFYRKSLVEINGPQTKHV